MPDIRPFVGLLYDPAVAGPFDRLTAPPWDAISRTDQDRYHALSPYNAVRLILGRRQPGDDSSVNKYTRAAHHLRSWRKQGVLRPVEGPALYPYQMTFQLGGVRRSVRGVIAEIGLEEWGGSIIPHERTFEDQLADRLKLLRHVTANLSPVYAVVPGPVPELAGFLRAAMEGQPDREVVDEAGTRHQLWVVAETPGESGPTIARACRALGRETLMIADGHHRYSVALAYRSEMRSRYGPGPWDAMMMLVVDAGSEDPPVLPIHRLAQPDASRLQPQGERVRDMAEVLATLDDDTLTYGSVAMEEGEPVHRLARLAGEPPTVCALHQQILDQAPGLRLRFLPDAVRVEEAVQAQRGALGYLLPHTTVGRVFSVVRSGARLPQKSTYFWPKPRTGMVIRPLRALG
jgi:uncharacterized protein (DUF1015 family)